MAKGSEFPDASVRNTNLDILVSEIEKWSFLRKVKVPLVLDTIVTRIDGSHTI